MHNSYSGIRFTVLLISFVFLPAWNASAYNMKVDYSRERSFFIVSAHSSDGKENYALWDEDVSSTAWILFINGAAVTPSEDGWNRDYNETNDGYTLKYKNRVYTLENRIVLSSSRMYLHLSSTFTNNSSEKVTISQAFLLDTVLGEVTGLPFRKPDGSYIDSEDQFTGAKIPEWIGTVKSNDQPGLYIFFNDDSLADRPESVTLANWLRLKQSPVGFPYVEGRSFDNPPYSESDSAMLIHYHEKSLEPGESLTVNILMGLTAVQPDADSFKQPDSVAIDPEKENFNLRSYTLKQRLAGIEVLLDELNKLLEKDDAVSENTVNDIKEKLQYQEKLLAEYENL